MQKPFPIIAGFLLLALAIWLQLTHIAPIAHLITRLENLAYDLQIQTRRLTSHPLTESPVVIADIDDHSIAAEGRWPWPRTKLAALINQLKVAGAAVVAFDVIFPEKEANPDERVLNVLSTQKQVSPKVLSVLTKAIPLFDDDARFAQALATMDTVLGVTFLPRAEMTGLLPHFNIPVPAHIQLFGLDTLQGYLANISVLQLAAKSAGFINVFPDDDGIVRRTPLLLRYKGAVYPSLALEAVRVYLLSQLRLKVARYYDQTRLEGIVIGKRVIPTDANGQALIPFQGGSFYFPYYSATDIIHGHIPSDSLSGKIVFVGTSATSLADLRATSVQSIYPGVEIHATIAFGILNNLFSSRPSWELGAEVCLTFFTGLLWIFLFPVAGPRLLTVFVIVIPCAFLFLNNLLWQETGLILSVFIPATFAVLLGVVDILYGYFFETRHREKLRAMFGQYVPETHITEMLTKPGDYTLYGEDRTMTVLFADIRNFTTISEGRTADQLKEILNAFFTPMTEIIFRYSGTIDKYIGDMIMAFWGAPLVDEEHARHAIQASLEMQKMVQELQATFFENKWPEIRMGIGINTGLMSVGDMGSRFRRNYTVLGDAVNLGSRVESLTKFYGAKIIVTENTEAGQDDFVFRQLDRVQVKGKKASIDIYEPICLVSELPESLHHELEKYHNALELYFAMSWDRAYEQFASLHQEYPDSPLYQIYLRRIEEFRISPPPADWTGVYTHTTK